MADFSKAVLAAADAILCRKGTVNSHAKAIAKAYDFDVPFVKAMIRNTTANVMAGIQ